ncbi:hypothetical protein FQR65_LT12026 [Abscondita terminalis]|nr:hypothetical protein FQR65_LT12026 [Abscondita terminalis]
MAPVLLFLATHVALALNSNRYNNVTENSTKLKHVNYFKKEITQAVISSYSNKGAINSNINNYETLPNINTPRTTATTFRNIDKVLTSSFDIKANDEVNLQTTQTSNSNINYNYESHVKLDELNDAISTTLTTVYVQEKHAKKSINASLVKDKNFTIINFKQPHNNSSLSNKTVKDKAQTKIEITTNISKINGNVNTYQTNRYKKALTNSLLTTPATVTRETHVTIPNNGSLNRLSTFHPKQILTKQDVDHSTTKVTSVPENFKRNTHQITTKEFATSNNRASKNGVLTTPMPQHNINRIKTMKNESILNSTKAFTTRPTQFVLNLNSSNAIDKASLNETLTTQKHELNCINCFNVSTSSPSIKHTENEENFSGTPVLENYLDGSTTDIVLNNYKELIVTTDVSVSKETTAFVDNDTFVDNRSDVSVKIISEFPWPVKKEAVVEGDLVLGGLMMVHERRTP